MSILRLIGIGLIIAVLIFTGFLLKAVLKMEAEIKEERMVKEEE